MALDKVVWVWVWVALVLGATRRAAGEERMLGPADVVLKRVEQCPGADGFEMREWRVERTKVSRTVDAFSASFQLDKPLDHTIGVYVNVAKNGDGGWKENFYVMEERDACGYLMRYLEGNFKAVLAAAGAAEQCPVAASTYSLERFVVDHADLPENLTYGEFRVDAFLTDATRANKRVLCLRLFADAFPKKQD